MLTVPSDGTGGVSYGLEGMIMALAGGAVSMKLCFAILPQPAGKDLEQSTCQDTADAQQ